MLQTTAAKSFSAEFARAASQLGALTILAMIGLLIGWFFTDTLVASMGPLEHGVRFFSFAEAAANPMQLFIGGGVTWATCVFGLICVICILAPLLPHWTSNRALWPAYWAPLLLMFGIGVLLYLRAAHDLFDYSDIADPVNRDLVRLANDLVNKGGQLVTRHLKVGVGGYIAVIASAILAVRGFQLVRKAGPRR